MTKKKVIQYRVSYWTKGYNKGKINVLLETESNEAMLIENLTPEHGIFLLDFLSHPGSITCDTDFQDGIINLHGQCVSQV